VKNTLSTSAHITKTPTHYKTNTHTYAHPHITKQVKKTTVQVKNTVQDIPKSSTLSIRSP